uniref:Uncharacterized protein n=1 Tax=Naja naja TaxID=35670 RepID=A0A8C6Y870_NAJNA
MQTSLGHETSARKQRSSETSARKQPSSEDQAPRTSHANPEPRCQLLPQFHPVLVLCSFSIGPLCFYILQSLLPS